MHFVKFVYCFLIFMTFANDMKRSDELCKRENKELNEARARIEAERQARRAAREEDDDDDFDDDDYDVEVVYAPE